MTIKIKQYTHCNSSFLANAEIISNRPFDKSLTTFKHQRKLRLRNYGASWNIFTWSLCERNGAYLAAADLVEIPTSTRHLNASNDGRRGWLSEANFSSDSRLQQQQHLPHTCVSFAVKKYVSHFTDS